MSEAETQRREAAGRLFGLPVGTGGTAPIGIEQVEHWGIRGWMFVLAGTSIPSCRFFVEAAAENAGGFCRTEHLVLGYTDDEVPPLLLALLKRFRQRLEGRTWEQVHAWLDGRFGIRRDRDGGGDPVDGTNVSALGASSESGSAPGGSTGAGKARPAVAQCPGVHISWNHPQAWHRFFADEEFLPFRDAVIRYNADGGVMVRAEHGDLECQFLPPRGFISPPWHTLDRYDNRARHWSRKRAIVRQKIHHMRHEEPPKPVPLEEVGLPGRRRTGIPLSKLALIALVHAASAKKAVGAAIPTRRNVSNLDFFTNLVDMDVIQGSTGVLEDLLEGIRETVNPSTLFVNCTCVPQIIGDDIDYVIRTERARSPYPLLFKDQRPKDPWDKNIAMMRQAFADAPPVARDPLAVNLIGFMDGRDRDELSALLGSLGVRVRACLLPELHPKMAVGYLEAPLQVFGPSKDWERLYTQIFGDLDIASLHVDAPYGMAATTAFLGAVVEGLGRPDLVPRIAEREAAFRAGAWDPLVERASRHRVGIVCELGRQHRLAGFGSPWGVPLVRALREMGFQIALALVAEPDGRDAAAAAAATWAGDGVATSVVTSPSELDGWLADPGIEAVYSDFFYDDRLVRSGHAPFSLAVFSRGWEGAARTTRRILARCEAGYFRDCRVDADRG